MMNYHSYRNGFTNLIFHHENMLVNVITPISSWVYVSKDSHVSIFVNESTVSKRAIYFLSGILVTDCKCISTPNHVTFSTEHISGFYPPIVSKNLMISC